MSANPWQTPNFDPGSEEREIRRVMEADNRKHRFEVFSYPGIHREELERSFITFANNRSIPHILHLSVHGSWDGNLAVGIPLELGNASVSQSPYGSAYDLLSKRDLCDMLSLLLAETGNILECIFLNACHSSYQAEILLEKVNLSSHGAKKYLLITHCVFLVRFMLHMPVLKISNWPSAKENKNYFTISKDWTKLIFPNCFMRMLIPLMRLCANIIPGISKKRLKQYGSLTTSRN